MALSEWQMILRGHTMSLMASKGAKHWGTRARCTTADQAGSCISQGPIICLLCHHLTASMGDSPVHARAFVRAT